LFQKAEVVMIFLSLPDEVDTRTAIEAAWADDKTVLVPKIVWTDRHLEAVELVSFDDSLADPQSGLRWPPQTPDWDVARIDLVVTPGLAFDRHGHRLGRGAGFYDRFFDRQGLRATRCGFGFSEQLVETVPMTPSDRLVDWVVTDEQTIKRK
jgi:5-formyltetrahydrofolate cyclo-ligase